MSTITQQLDKPQILNFLTEFDELHGDELDACFPEAYDLIYDLMQSFNDLDLNGIIDRINQFYLEYGDEMDGCNEDGLMYIKTNFKNILEEN